MSDLVCYADLKTMKKQSRKGFSILQENDQDARRAKEMAASARRRAVRWSLRLLADRSNHQSHRSTLDDEWRTPASEGSGADAEKVLADYSRPPEICRRGGKVPSL
jgi:hypothetical protein